MGGETLFISDLHLDAQRPEVTALFEQFMDDEAPRAAALYILGDLFEAWIGDDDDDPFNRDMVQRIRRVADSAVPVYFIHGNRDFLVGERFARETGCRLLPDPTVIDLHGARAVLTHGDMLCTDDVEYQNERERVRDPSWQEAVLAKPLEERRAIAQDARARSRENKRRKPDEIMDVNQDAVRETLRGHGVRLMIHGHTHRPAVHELELDGEAARRIVLGDWHAVGSVLRCDASGCRLETLEPNR